MSESEVGGPHSKSCQGCGARPGMRSSFSGKVGFGAGAQGRGPGSPWASVGEAGPAAGLCLLLGKRKHTGPRAGEGIRRSQEGPQPCLHAACSLFSGGRPSQPSGLQEQPPRSPSRLEAGSTMACRLDPAQGSGWRIAWSTLLFPRRSWSSGCGQQPGLEPLPGAPSSCLTERAPRPQPWPPPSQPHGPRSARAPSVQRPCKHVGAHKARGGRLGWDQPTGRPGGTSRLARLEADGSRLRPTDHSGRCPCLPGRWPPHRRGSGGPRLWSARRPDEAALTARGWPPLLPLRAGWPSTCPRLAPAVGLPARPCCVPRRHLRPLWAHF